MMNVHRYLLLVLFLLGLQSFSLAVEWEISPWNDDASSGIDSAKTYTHAINISNDIATTVNGVEFTSSWGDFANGSLDGGGWIDWDDDNTILGSSYQLSRDFRYGNSLLVLSGLTPGVYYELTFFSTGWENGERLVTLSDQSGTFQFNQDEYGINCGIKIVGFYLPDDNGELRINTVGGFHIYAFANCEYTGKLPVDIRSVSPKEFEGGNRYPVNTNFSWTELYPGSLANPAFDVYVSTDESKVSNMDAEALVGSRHEGFEFTTELDPNALYYWRVATYFDADDSEPNIVTDIRSFRTEYIDEHWTGYSWNDDSDLNISPGKIYTHKVNLSASESAETTVNNVVFENDTDHSGTNWSLEGDINAATQGHNVGGDGGTLVNATYYGNNAVLTLTGLTPGQDYVLTQYVQGWGNPGERLVHFLTEPDNRVTTLDGNVDGNGNGHIFMYSYTAPASGDLEITFEPLNTSNTWHHYAFSNEVDVPAYVDPTPLPGEFVNNDLELSWEVNGEVANPTYNLKVATNEAMTNLVVNKSGLSETSQDVQLELDKVYYWQVEIVEDGGSVIYSSPAWSFVTTPPQEALKVIEWKFDETTGIIAEQTAPTEDADGKLVGFNDPNSIGNSSHIAGLVNNGLYLNGRDEYVDVSDAYKYMPTASGQSFAISGYIRTLDNFGPIFSMRNEEDENPIIDIALGADGIQEIPGEICVLVRDDQGSLSNMHSGITVNDGLWHNFIVSRVESRWTLYIDGVSRANINGAATGNVDLNLMSIGTSLRWIKDGWADTVERDFCGIIDEFCVWDGELIPSQIASLSSILPGLGDIDFDMDTDIDDLTGLASNWLADTKEPVQDVFVVEDMESYESGETSFADNWFFEAEEGFGNIQLSVITDPNIPSQDQIMKIDYDFDGQAYSYVFAEVPNRGAYLGLYEQVDITLKKLPGCDISEVILDFFDGRGKVDPALNELYNVGRMVFNVSDIAQNEWVTLSGTLPDTYNIESCSDLFLVLLTIQDGGEDVGTFYFDSIVLSDSTEDCVPQIGQMVPDFNGDCSVDLVDFSDIAESWLSTN